MPITLLAGGWSPTIQTARRDASERRALTALSLSMLLSSLGTSIANVGLPALAEAFHASFQTVQWVVIAYLLATTSLIVGAGRLGDRLGRRRLLLTGLTLFAIASIGAAVAPTLATLILARALQGFGAAIMLAMSLALTGASVPKERTGRAMGLLGTMSALGTALGPSLGGVLIAGAGWRAIFLINAPLALLAIVMIRRWVPAERPTAATDGPAFDKAGAFLLAVALAAYSLALTIGHGRFGMRDGALLLVALAAGAGFLVVERRAAAPLIGPTVFRNHAFGAGLLLNAMVSTVMMATMVVGPFHLAGALELAPAQVGFVLAIGPMVTASTGVLAGRMADRYGAGRMIRLGLSGLALGSAWIAVSNAGFGLAGYVLPLLVVTSGYALFQTANTAAIMAGLAPEDRGMVSGLVSLSRNLGLITGSTLMGAVFVMGAGTTDISHALPETVAAGTRTTFGVAAGLGLLALLVGRMAGDPPSPSTPGEPQGGAR